MNEPAEPRRFRGERLAQDGSSGGDGGGGGGSRGGGDCRGVVQGAADAKAARAVIATLSVLLGAAPSLAADPLGSGGSGGGSGGKAQSRSGAALLAAGNRYAGGGAALLAAAGVGHGPEVCAWLAAEAGAPPAKLRRQPRDGAGHRLQRIDSPPGSRGGPSAGRAGLSTAASLLMEQQVW